MLKRLHLQNFTVFADADFEFGPGLNVLVGTNGTGKSHVLKLGYSVLYALADVLKEVNWVWNEKNLRRELTFKLEGVFQPEQKHLKRLIRHGVKEDAIVICEISKGKNVIVDFHLHSENNGLYLVGLNNLPEKPIELIEQPIYIPAKEVLTLAWISRLGEKFKLPIDDTYIDLLELLRQIPLKKLNFPVAEILEKIEMLIGGSIELEGERYYLIPKQGERIEADLLAEGIRKFGMLAQLLGNGSLSLQSALFWDEPEANLNPALLRKLAAILAELARQGFQIILATHSMSLLKEFHILSRQKDAKPLPIKYFGLNAGPSESTHIVTTDNFEYLPDVVGLEVELEQADDLEEIFVREDRQFHADNRGKE